MSKFLAAVGKSPHQPSTEGRDIARCLEGAWRESPPSWPLLDLGNSASESAEASDEEAHEEQSRRLLELVPLLVESGAGALAWWKLRSSPWRGHRIGAPLLESFHAQALAHELKEREIERILLALDKSGIEPVLLKGWSTARLYVQRGLRPLGDIDLLVRPEEAARASQVLEQVREPEGVSSSIDLHSSLPLYYSRTATSLIDASHPVALRGTRVRVLCPEDHLRLLCLHFLRHGAWRPLWLCDIAALLESLPTLHHDDESEEPGQPVFNWQRCLNGDKVGDSRARRSSEWVVCALGLARDVLGARMDGAPLHVREAPLPSWVRREMLRAWNRPRLQDHWGRAFAAKAVATRSPQLTLGAAVRRWPSHFQIAVDESLPSNRRPARARQVRHVVLTGARFLRRVPTLLRSESPRTPG